MLRPLSKARAKARLRWAPTSTLREQRCATVRGARRPIGGGGRLSSRGRTPVLPLGNGGRTLAFTTAGVASGAGLVSFLYRNSHRAIPANIAENTRRKAARAATNAEIAARNASRLAQTKLIITPSAGVGR